MPEVKANPKLLTIFQKFLWWIAGAEIDILKECPSDWHRFNNKGAFLILSFFQAAISGTYAFRMFTPYNFILAHFGGILWGVIILIVERSVLLTFPKSPLTAFAVLPIVFRSFLMILISYAIAQPILVSLFEKDIVNYLNSVYQQPQHQFSYINKGQALSVLLKRDKFVLSTYWSILACIVVIDTLPLIFHIFSPIGLYDVKLKNKIELKIRESNAETEKEIRNMLDNRHEKKYKLSSEIPLGGIEMYIDYKSLPVNDMNKLFDSLNNIYTLIYEIGFLKQNIPLDLYIKSHPEDILKLYSIETGNSIIFKIGTGWQPNVELIEGDFVVTVPKGSVAFLITGFFLIQMFHYGISDYKELLEIEKLKKENRKLDNEIFLEELTKFNAHLQNSDDEIKTRFQKELTKFYMMTLENENYIQTKIQQDTLILNQINNGKFSLSAM